MAGIAKDISELYLNEEWSDARIIIDNKSLPVHRVILVQRCPYFKTMFKSGLAESNSNRIVIRETQLDNFKTVLKWIYTEEAEFQHVDDALAVLRLAHMYQLTELVSLVVTYLQKECTVDNALKILNISILLSLDKLTDWIAEFVDDNSIKVLEHDTFAQLSKETLMMILSEAVSAAPDICVFRAVIRWMKTNSSQSVYFLNVMRYVPLQDITFGELISVSSDVLDVDVLKKITVEQYTAIELRRKLRGQNVALPKYGVNVVAGGETAFFSSPNAGNVLKHTIGSSEEGIVVALGHCFKLNSFKMQLVEAVNRNFSYWIDVSADNVSWTRVIDHSKYACRSLQKLYFKARPVLYIRICGTAPSDEIFEVSSLEALYTTEKFEIDPETTLLIPSYNVALAEKKAIIIQGHSIPADALIDGTFNSYNKNRGFTWNYISSGIIVQLPQPYILDSMKLLLYDKDNRIYSYNIEVSVDQVAWTKVYSEEKVASWREIHFDSQPVVFVKLTATFQSGNGFMLVHLECYAQTIIL